MHEDADEVSTARITSLQQGRSGRLGRAFLAPSEVLEGLGANPLVFVGLSAILPLLHTYSYTFKVSKSIRRSLRLL